MRFADSISPAVITARALGRFSLLSLLYWSAACTGVVTLEIGNENADADADAAVSSADGTVSSADAAVTRDANGELNVEVEGPPIRPHVQAFANAACAAVGACGVATYEGHHPSADLALDFLTSEAIGTRPTDNNALGDELADYVLAQQDEAGVRYVIWRQRYNDGGGWSAMEDRGSITQNHYDHVHVSFEESP